jgi:hypothetical protein
LQPLGCFESGARTRHAHRLLPLLNETLQKFVRTMVTDPDISQRIVATR